MKIGIPKEVKPAEKRIALVPDACIPLVEAGHQVMIETSAGAGAGFSDQDYLSKGVEVKDSASMLYDQAELIVKVKEPQESEYALLKREHLLFCYLHLAAGPGLTQSLKEIGLTAIAFETVEVEGVTPLLAPMSAIAGRLSIQLGSHFLHSPKGGRGILLGGLMHQPEGNVTVIGGGTAGREAAILAAAMGAEVTLLDISQDVLHHIQRINRAIHVRQSSNQALEELLPRTDLLIGSVYLRGKKAPYVVSRDQVQLMPEGSVIVDISIDQGGCVESSRPCSYFEPTFEYAGVIHSGITNLPAAVPVTASKALSNAISPYVRQLAAGDWSQSLKQGINVQDHQLVIEF